MRADAFEEPPFATARWFLLPTNRALSMSIAQHDEGWHIDACLCHVGPFGFWSPVGPCNVDVDPTGCHEAVPVPSGRRPDRDCFFLVNPLRPSNKQCCIRLTTSTIEQIMAFGKRHSVPGFRSIAMRRHILGDAALLTPKGLVRGFGPALDPIKRFCRNFSKSLLSGLWTLGVSCGVCAAPFAYIADRDGVAAGISVIDTTSNSVVARIPVAARNVAISPDGSFVDAATSTGVAIISTATHGVVATVPVEPSMERVAMSPDGAFVYATGGQGYPGPGHVSVISTATRQVTATVPIRNAAVAIDVFPDGAFVYVTRSV
jgi:hypothetical protein